MVWQRSGERARQCANTMVCSAFLGGKPAMSLPASRHIVCPVCHNIYSQQLECDRVRSVSSFKLDSWLGLFELVQKKKNLYTKWHLGREVLAFQNTNGIINSWVSRTTADVRMGSNRKSEKWKVKWIWRALYSGSSVVSCKTWTDYWFPLISQAGVEGRVWHSDCNSGVSVT